MYPPKKIFIPFCKKGIAHYTKAAMRFGAVRPCRGLFIVNNS